MAREQHHGRLVREGRIERADGIGMTRSTRHHRNAGLARETPPRVGHMYGRRLVAHVDQLELRLERGVEDRHDMIAGEREDLLRPKLLQRARDDVRASDLVGHGRRSFPCGGAPVNWAPR